VILQTAPRRTDSQINAIIDDKGKIAGCGAQLRITFAFEGQHRE
jgi:hypothetical protein